MSKADEPTFTSVRFLKRNSFIIIQNDDFLFGLCFWTTWKLFSFWHSNICFRTGVASAFGEVFSAVGERAKDMNEKYQITQKTGEAARNIASEAKKFDEKHQVKAKTADGFQKLAGKAKEMNEKHQIQEKASEGLSKFANMIKGGGKDSGGK